MRWRAGTSLALAAALGWGASCSLVNAPDDAVDPVGAAASAPGGQGGSSTGSTGTGGTNTGTGGTSTGTAGTGGGDCVPPYDTLTDCGACGVPCAPEHATGATCDGGVCDYQTCDANFGDCDDNRANGCELPLDTLTDCGDCDVPCTPSHVLAATCDTGTCDHTGCSGDWRDCDGNTANGCETDRLTDAAHCGTCNHSCAPDTCVGGNCTCVPTGSRAPLNTLSQDTATGCWNGNPCPYDAYAWDTTHGQSFFAFGELITCSGTSSCVGHVGVGTYSLAANCQGAWDVRCDGVSVGTLNTVGKGCAGSAMTNGCSISFTPRRCSTITLVAATDTDTTHPGCCGGPEPESMVVAVSAW